MALGSQLRRFPHFLMCMVLEWVLTIVFFLDGFLAFFAIGITKYFGLETPCWLCARMNHVLAFTTPDFYYNNSICEAHKKDVSSMAFCHRHKKLSDIRKLCDACMLSFATGKESGCDTYKSLVAVLNKNLECSVENAQNAQASLKDDGVLQAEKSSAGRCCSCCGAPLVIEFFLPRAPTSSPKALPHLTPKNEESGGLKSMPLNGSELPPLNKEGDKENNQNITLREEDKGACSPLLTEASDSNIATPKTPLFPWSSKFFGFPLADSPNSSPKWPTGLSKRSSLASELNDGNGQEEAGDAIMNKLKSQVRLDRKSLMALYTELETERSASTVAANNAMAMITRLQEEKAALQIDALQHQRMMEEQIEYDEEALEEYNEMLLKLEEEIKKLEIELEIYRDRYGGLTEDDITEVHSSQGGNEENVEKDLNLHQAVSSKADNGAGKLNESLRDFRMEKTYALGQMKKMENITPIAESGI